MSDLIVLQNELGLDGMRRVHAMASASFEAVPGVEIPAWAVVKPYQDELRLHHLEAIWRPRGEMVQYEMQFGGGCAWTRLVCLWCMMPGEHIREAIWDAADAYARKTGQDPEYAWVRQQPQGVRYGQDVPIWGNAVVCLFWAEWMPVGAVAVGRGN